MATKKTIEVPCWCRRFVTEEEMRSMLKLTRPQWKDLKKAHPLKVVPNMFGRYDRESIEQFFARL